MENMNPLKIIINPSDRDWTEDFEDESGCYTNTCIECKLTFNGYKRRVICKLCGTPNWLEISKRKRPEDTKDNKAWAGAWLEGEMVGFAKCMIEQVEPLKQKIDQMDTEINRLMNL